MNKVESLISQVWNDVQDFENAFLSLLRINFTSESAKYQGHFSSAIAAFKAIYEAFYKVFRYPLEAFLQIIRERTQSISEAKFDIVCKTCSFGISSVMFSTLTGFLVLSLYLAQLSPAWYLVFSSLTILDIVFGMNYFKCNRMLYNFLYRSFRDNKDQTK